MRGINYLYVHTWARKFAWVGGSGKIFRGVWPKRGGVMPKNQVLLHFYNTFTQNFFPQNTKKCQNAKKGPKMPDLGEILVVVVGERYKKIAQKFSPPCAHVCLWTVPNPVTFVWGQCNDFTIFLKYVQLFVQFFK